MFAFALWDEHERKLVLARDRFGEKPIYWGWQGDVFLFGSELKALRAHPNFKSEVDRNALALFLRHNYVPAPYSIYQGIEKLRPGHYLSVQIDSADKSLRSVSYWDINDAINCGLASPFMGSDKEAIDRLDEILTTGISGQMLADVPLGAFLSGGVDSSVIVALMQKQSSRPIRTFTIGFHEAGFNEAEHALAVSRYLGTEHTEVYVGASDALSLVPNLPHIYCEPFADSSQIPTFLVSQMARQHVTVALSGDAGDELFGGYNPYRFAPRVWNKLSTVPLSVRRASAYLASWSNFPAKVTKLLEVGNAPTREEFYRRLISHWLYPEQVVLNSHEPSTLLSQPGSWPYVDNFEHWMMAMDAQTYMVDDILVKVDRAAMANSLETRVPLLDHRLVEFAWSLPFHMKIRDGKGKWILRELLYRYVPKELIERPKKGFSIPLGNWLKGPLREWSESLLDPSRLAQEGYFNSQIVAKVWREHLAGKSDRSRQLWSILMFQSWLREQGH